MANGKLSRAQVGLALASALVVLLASGVAISRISERDGESPVATGPSSTSSSVPGLGGEQGPVTGSGPATGAAAGGPAEQAAPASGEAATAETPVTHGVTRTAPKAPSDASASAASSGPTGTGSVSASPGGSPSGGASQPSGGSQGGGQGSPPAPSRQPPEPLAAAAVSAGQGAEGAVVGAGVNGSPDLDVTVGTNQLVGDHPPSEGTGVTFGGRLLHPSSERPGLGFGGHLHPPPSLPVLPG